MKLTGKRVRGLFVSSLVFMTGVLATSYVFSAYDSYDDKGQGDTAPDGANDKKTPLSSAGSTDSGIRSIDTPAAKIAADSGKKTEPKTAGENANSAEVVPQGINRLEIHILSPADRSIVSKTVTIQADALADAGLNYVELYADTLGSTKLTKAPYKVEWDTTKAKDGQACMIYAIVVDKSGAIARQEIHVIVKNK